MSLTIPQFEDIFVNRFNLIEKEHFDQLLKYADETRRPVEQVLMERSFITPHQYLDLLADYFDMPGAELGVASIDAKSLRSLPEEFAVEHKVIVFGRTDDNLFVAVTNPADEKLLAELKTKLDPFAPEVKLYVTTEFAIKRALMFYDGDFQYRLASIIKELGEPAESLASQPSGSDAITELVNSIIEAGIIHEASDVHIEPDEVNIGIRFRVDGVLQSVASLPKKYHDALLVRLKILANLKIDQKRIPQDGRFSLNFKGQEVNVRLSIVPSMWGEKPVLRLLPKEAHLFDINNLGLLEKDAARIRDYIRRPHGLVLVCGPTGSGKTTGLYAFLQELGTERIDSVNISTIEDPIEYTIPRVTQIQINPSIELTFASGLRALLRQDPDIIMVGEIRDAETAEFVTRAALVGRLVLSSLHTNDAPGAIPRLLNMGLEPYVVSSTLTMIIAQRLARKLCNFCRQSYTPDDTLLHELRENHGLDQALVKLKEIGIINEVDDEIRFYKATGCERCGNSGYRSRVGVFEVLEVDDALRKAINGRTDSSEIAEIAKAQGMKTLFEDGLAKVVLGQIDIDELFKVAYS